MRAEKAAAAVCVEVGGGSEVRCRQTADNRETERERVTGASSCCGWKERRARREAGARWCAG